jgi:hypothetical protein
VSLLRIREVMPVEGFRLRLTLTDGSIVERDITDLLLGPMFETIRKDTDAFRQVTVVSGTAVWPNGADLCPDVLIWGGAPPMSSAVPPQSLTLKSPSLVR